MKNRKVNGLKKPNGCESGQGLLEYILLIAAVLSFVVAVAIPFNASQQKGIDVIDTKVTAATSVIK